MKKLMMAVAVVALAIGANAAMVDWQYKITSVGTSAASYPEYANLNAGKYVAYLFDETTWETALAEGITKTTFEDAEDSGKLFRGANSAGKYPFGTRQDTATGTTLNMRAISGEGGSYYLVLVDTSADTWKYNATEKELASRTEQGGAIAENALSVTYTTFHGYAWTNVNVPEPTSGLLLLLGMAGLALRRRRA